MRGHGFGHIVAENVAATKPLLEANQREGHKKRMCWKCQEEKHTKGGHMTMFKGGPMKFICKDCMEAKAQAKQQGESNEA